MRLRKEHIDIMVKVFLSGAEIPEKILISSDEQPDVAELIAAGYLERVTSARKKWLQTKSNPIVSGFYNFRETLCDLKITL